MALTVPSKDGEVNQYNLGGAGVQVPRIYYVNGIRTPGRDHAVTAALLSILCERPVWGVYNRTDGAILDLVQCLFDYTQNAGARLTGNRKLIPGQQIQDRDIPNLIDETISNSVVWNQATVALFKEMVNNHGARKLIVAHSQGNLITSNALFVVEKVLGSDALKNVRVYSLASPSPAWPLGLSITNGGGGRQDNAFMNDLVALLRPHNMAAKVGFGGLQNAGDFRTHTGFGKVGVGPHAVNLNIALNFLKSVRGDIGLPKEFSADFLDKASKKAEEAIKALGGT